MTYNASQAEREAYINGYSAIKFGDVRLDIFPENPFNDRADYLLWEAWEVGFNDAYEDEVTIINIVKGLTDG
jgi:hypothetical protein